LNELPQLLDQPNASLTNASPTKESSMSVYKILDEITAYHGLGEEYGKKQLHKVPETEVVKNRRDFIVQYCKGKKVLNIGCNSGPLHQELMKVCYNLWGVDKEKSENEDHSWQVIPLDLDKVNGKDTLPFPQDLGIEVVVCGEVLEHLANPGWFLQRLIKTLPEAVVIITVPNAFSKGAHNWNGQRVENVNLDHVSWYSYRTLKTLVERYNYSVERWYWYNGKPQTAEGLIFVCINSKKKVPAQTSLETLIDED
jgi:2-polyprenyl-3-methyl-5-hydroxy-6-metoxy-1,4-benzoquinol methylase